jgi:hypothetical protein
MAENRAILRKESPSGEGNMLILCTYLAKEKACLAISHAFIVNRRETPGERFESHWSEVR